jgi:type IV pilus assembly protein PilY1
MEHTIIGPYKNHRSSIFISCFEGRIKRTFTYINALDVTNPKLFSEAYASKLSLWEFTDDDDPDLGYTFGKPVITKLASGDWVAIFNNGYDSTEENDDISGDDSKSANGEAILYIVDIKDGTFCPE